MKFRDLVPGNSLSVLCLDPITEGIKDIVGGIVEGLNNSKTILGVRMSDPTDKSKMIVIYFRVNPDSEVNNSLLEDKEHRMMAVFETRTSCIDKYIEYCESKIEQYKNNIKNIRL